MLSRRPTLGVAVISVVLGATLSVGGSPLSGQPVARAAESAADQPATVLRVTLGRLLAEHAYLTLEAMRSVALSGGDRQAIVTALRDNTEALSGAVESVYGAGAADVFERLWNDHIDGVVAYAEAVTAGNLSGAEAALGVLAEYRNAFSAFLAGANPEISADGEAVALQLHLDQLTAFADGDYALGFETGREAYSHMFTLGDDLAKAIAAQFPDRFPGARVAFSPKAELRVALGRLLGEHLVLAAEAMRSGLSGTPDFDSAKGALDANSRDLAAAVGGVYGDEAGRAFLDLWITHTAAYLEYIEAFDEADDAAKAEALATLRDYPDEFATFISAANPNLPEEAVQDLIRRHGEALISQVDAYAARDYPRSVTIVAEAHTHMFDVADALADGIAAQFPDRFSDLSGAPATDTAGTSQGAGAGSSPSTLLAVLVLMSLAAGVIARTSSDRRDRVRSPVSD